MKLANSNFTSMKIAMNNKDKNLIRKLNQNMRAVKCKERWYTHLFKALPILTPLI